MELIETLMIIAYVCGIIGMCFVFIHLFVQSWEMSIALEQSHRECVEYCSACKCCYC